MLVIQTASGFDRCLFMEDNNYMNTKRFSIIVAVVVAVLASPFVKAETAPLDDARLQAVVDQCQNIQRVLLNTQQSDKLARINRGHVYETTLQLLVNFNARIVSSKYDAPDLLTITGDYQSERKKFVETYTKYDDNVASLSVMNCRSQPTEFYERLVEVRAQRAELSASVQAIDQLIERYHNVVKSLRKQVAMGAEKP